MTSFILTGPTVLHPQYYGVQAPWGIYPANLIQQQGQQTPQGMSSQQQQQQQMMRNQTGRPLTPSQQNDSSQPLTPNAPSEFKDMTSGKSLKYQCTWT